MFFKEICSHAQVRLSKQTERKRECQYLDIKTPQLKAILITVNLSGSFFGPFTKDNRSVGALQNMCDLQIYSRHKRCSFFFNLKTLKSTISKTFVREKEIPISQLCDCITFKVVSLRSDDKDGPKNLRTCFGSDFNK